MAKIIKASLPKKSQYKAFFSLQATGVTAKTDERHLALCILYIMSRDQTFQISTAETKAMIFQVNVHIGTKTHKRKR